MSSRSTLAAQLPAADLQQIDLICDRFEAEWRAGQRPDLASYLSEAPPGGKAPLFHDLLNLELEYRLENGDRPEPRSYHEQFPELASMIDAAFAIRHDDVTATRQGNPS